MYVSQVVAEIAGVIHNCSGGGVFAGGKNCLSNGRLVGQWTIWDHVLLDFTV